ncbi:hypothetical protein HPB49_007810 [Dermacentor silvarum]|uniref:Uncharacterized protein n=1 Tax=Dermacentor silvarum TaxID=543639 RepID=A0ACB8CK22_DERSI|nr:hypothetical protein HPB49_007810 [Dermacentor silvarum]
MAAIQGALALVYTSSCAPDTNWSASFSRFLLEILVRSNVSCGADKCSGMSRRQNEETYRKWQRNIPRVDKPLERNAALCKLHFDPQFVSRHFEHVISGELVRLERSRPLLQPDAILTIFPNVPKYTSKPVPKKSNPKEMLDPQFAPPQKRNSESTWPHPTHRMKHPRLPPTLDYQNVIVPSNQWGKHAKTA